MDGKQGPEKFSKAQGRVTLWLNLVRDGVASSGMTPAIEVLV